MKRFPKVMAFFVCIVLIATSVSTLGCAEGVSGEIELWSFLTQEEVDSYVELYHSINPNVKVNVTVFPGDQFTTKLQAVLRSGVNCPDVFTVEISSLGQLKETDFLMNLSDLGAEAFAAEQVPYVAALSRDEKGQLKGLSYQSCPGGFWYRKELAREYLGTDAPDEVSALLDSWDKIADLGASIYEKSNGTVALLDDVGTATYILLDTRDGAYVDENNQMQPLSFFREIGQIMLDIRTNNADAKRSIWSPSWASGFYSEKPFIVVGQPSWGLHYCVKANTPSDATDTDNTWGFAYAPSGYQSGGTWMSIYTGSKNAEAAWDFVRTCTVDEQYLTAYAESKGDMVGYIPAIEQVIANGYRDPFLGDQDIYEYFYKAAMQVEPRAVSKYDATIKSTFVSSMDLALDGQMTLDEAIAQFAQSIQNSYPDLIIVE